MARAPVCEAVSYNAVGRVPRATLVGEGHVTDRVVGGVCDKVRYVC